MTVLKFPAMRSEMTYSTIRSYGGTVECQNIMLCKGEYHSPERTTYAVILTCAPGAFDAFDIIAEFSGTDEGLSAAEFAAGIAHKTLSYSIMHQPDAENDYTAEEINAFCEEAEETFGQEAAVELRRKLTGRAA